MASKQDIINNVYYAKGVFGSKNRTLQEARKKDNTITKAKPRGGQNSFVAPNAYYEFQIDLFFINDIPKQKMKVGMMCIDIFFKYMVVVPRYVKTASGHFSRTDGMY